MQLARPEIVSLEPYVTAVQRPGTLRLNANETVDRDHGLNRYPPIRPDALRIRLAQRYGVPPGNLLVTRGSSEAIDVLVRSFCRAYTDNIIVTPPTFSMYGVYAGMQAAGVLDVPLRERDDFAFDIPALLEAGDAHSKLLFLCSPNNPTGNVIAESDVIRLARHFSNRALVIVDEAYLEFSDRQSLATAALQQENLVVLRTLSKSSGLAGARCGSVIASKAVIDLLSRMLPPYSFSTPASETLLDILQDSDRQAEDREAIGNIVKERERLLQEIADLRCVDKVWKSYGNFLLVRFNDLGRVAAGLDTGNILIRLFDGYPALRGCARITIGTATENDRLLDALSSLPEDPA